MPYAEVGPSSAEIALSKAITGNYVYITYDVTTGAGTYTGYFTHQQEDSSGVIVAQNIITITLTVVSPTSFTINLGGCDAVLYPSTCTVPTGFTPTWSSTAALSGD